MVDRQLLGDIGLAILLALPTAALSRPQAPLQHQSASSASPIVERAALAERSPVERRFSVDG